MEKSYWTKRRRIINKVEEHMNAIKVKTVHSLSNSPSDSLESGESRISDFRLARSPEVLCQRCHPSRTSAARDTECSCGFGVSKIQYLSLPRSPEALFHPSRSAAARDTECSCGYGVSKIQFEEAMRKVYFLLEDINEGVKDLKRQCAVTDNDSSASCLPEGLIFPINSVESLKKLESIIATEDNYQSVVNHLCLVGGDGVKAVVNNVMKKIFENAFAATMCWSGSRNKTEFQNLRIKDVIVSVTRSFHKSATDDIIKTVIRRWFHSAADRDGGRLRRTKQAIPC